MNIKKVPPPRGIQEDNCSHRETQVGRSEPQVHYSCLNPHNPQKFKIQIYENEFNVDTTIPKPKSDNPPLRRKNDIKTFSRKSRLRVLRKFNQLQTKVLSTPIFITLTARHQNHTPDEFQEIFLNSFLSKLKKIIPNCVYAWRMEPHEDGYPHIHMFAWSWDQERNLNSRYYKQQIRNAWLNLIEENNWITKRRGVWFENIGSRRKALHYVSKYVAKEPDKIDQRFTGRRWAVSTNFPGSPITEIYLSRTELQKLKRIAKRLLKNKGGNYEKRISFIEDAQNWFLWITLDEMMWILRELGQSSGVGDIIRYIETGSADDYTTEIERLAKKFPEKMGATG